MIDQQHFDNNENPGNFADQHAAVTGAGDIDEQLTEALSSSFLEETVVVEDYSESKGLSTHISLLNAVLMVNLDLTSRTIFAGATEFMKIDSDQGSINVYSPFKKESSADAKGIARHAFTTALNFVDSLNSSNLALLGDEAQVKVNLDSILEKMLIEVQASLPFSPEDTVCTVTLVDSDNDHDNETHIPILMKDIVRVTGWISRDDSSSSLMKPYTLTINFTVAAGEFYDETTPHKYLNSVRTFMANSKKRNNSTTGLVLGVTLLPEELYLVEVGDLMNALFTEDEKYDYTPLGRSSLQGGGSGKAWAPQTKAEVEKDLLIVGGDILIVKEF